jgi:hypothetical protein
VSRGSILGEFLCGCTVVFEGFENQSEVKATLWVSAVKLHSAPKAFLRGLQIARIDSSRAPPCPLFGFCQRHAFGPLECALAQGRSCARSYLIAVTPAR